MDARHLNAGPVRESLVAANQAERKVTKVLDRLADFRRANAERDAGLASQLDRIADAVQDDATKEHVRRVIAELRTKTATSPSRNRCDSRGSG